MRSRTPLTAACWVALLVLAPAVAGPEDPKAAQKPEPGKVKKAPVRAEEDEDSDRADLAVARAIARARGWGSSGMLMRSTVRIEDADDPWVVVVSEFGSGDVMIFRGNSDAAKDRCVTIDKANLDLLDEAIKRVRK